MEVKKAGAEKLRLDKYLWAIRIFKTRTQASSAIEEGKVRLAGGLVKPSHVVAIGEQYTIKTTERRMELLVTGLIPTRVAYEDAIKQYSDVTPEDEKLRHQITGTGFYTGKRISKTGHPSKKQRRDLEDFLSSAPED